MGEESFERKDGIPTYDGTPERLSLFREEAMQYMFTLECHKRYLAGPRLAARLTGVARTVIRKRLSQDPQWLAHPRGAYVLVDYLEQAIEKPTLVLASQHIQKFFYALRRKKGETMTQWTSRHSEALWEASRALQRVQKDCRVVSNATGGESTSAQPWSRTRNEVLRTELFDDQGRLPEEEEEEDSQSATAHSGWSWRQSDWQDGWGWQGWRSAEYVPPPSWETEVKDFIPDYLTGFLLLSRSGLDAHERANILAAIRGEFSVTAVERALKEQWNDEDLQRRDRLKHTANVAAGMDDGWDDDDDALAAHQDVPDYENEPEVFAAYMEEQSIIDSALEAIREKKRTLKEARWRQTQVRQSRKYYPSHRYPPSSRNHGSSSASQGSKEHEVKKCLKCGGPHSTANCPVKGQRAQVSEEAEIVFGATEEPSFPTALTNEDVLAFNTGELPDRILAGKGVIDCGATSTLGSVTALESIMANNLEVKGSDRVEVDPSVRPTFRFGNNGTKACLSTVNLGVDLGDKTGKLKIHVHDMPDQPVLISVKALKHLGAIVDFDRNEVIYRKVCDRSVVPLEAASNGHLLMPLNGNLLAGAQKRATAFVNLAAE